MSARFLRRRRRVLPSKLNDIHEIDKRKFLVQAAKHTKAAMKSQMNDYELIKAFAVKRKTGKSFRNWKANNLFLSLAACLLAGLLVEDLIHETLMMLFEIDIKINFHFLLCPPIAFLRQAGSNLLLI